MAEQVSRCVREHDLTLHRAPWLMIANDGAGRPLPPTVSVLEDGGVVVGSGCVVALGRFPDLVQSFPAARIKDHEASVLTAPLVNAHAHLELSILADLGREISDSPLAGGFPGWVRRLLARLETDRLAAGTSWQKRVEAAGRKTLAAMHRTGVGFLVDVGNQETSNCIGTSSRATVLFHRELLGLAGKAEQQALHQLAVEISPDTSCSPHAPYSCGPALLLALKQRSDGAGRLMTIHVAESMEEVEFLLHGAGALGHFLTERGVPLQSFVVPERGPVGYLDHLGILDAQTLCVHAVQVTDADIAILAERNAGVCLCPGSNRCLAVGVAPVEKYLAAGVRLSLGTDSLASNPELSIWREMRILRQDHPGLDPAAVFYMATNGGAATVGLADVYEGLESGRRACFLAVRWDGITPVNESDVIDLLTLEGEAAIVSRVDDVGAPGQQNELAPKALEHEVR